MSFLINILKFVAKFKFKVINLTICFRVLLIQMVFFLDQIKSFILLKFWIHQKVCYIFHFYHLKKMKYFHI
jgi:hypothetical protein